MLEDVVRQSKLEKNSVVLVDSTQLLRSIVSTAIDYSNFWWIHIYDALNTKRQNSFH